MSPEGGPTGSTQEISAAIAQITERAQVLVRDEIDLAKLELTGKAKTLGTGAAVAAAAGGFLFFATMLILEGLSWLAWYELFPDSEFFWGFFLVAAILLVVAALAGFFAYRALQTKPTPDMAIAEAHLIRETIAPHEAAPGAPGVPPVGTVAVPPAAAPVAPPPTPAPPVAPPPAPAPPPESPEPPADPTSPS